jgi:hypothetical protein
MSVQSSEGLPLAVGAVAHFGVRWELQASLECDLHDVTRGERCGVGGNEGARSAVRWSAVAPSRGAGVELGEERRHLRIDRDELLESDPYHHRLLGLVPPEVSPAIVVGARVAAWPEEDALVQVRDETLDGPAFLELHVRCVKGGLIAQHYPLAVEVGARRGVRCLVEGHVEEEFGRRAIGGETQPGPRVGRCKPARVLERALLDAADVRVFGDGAQNKRVRPVDGPRESRVTRWIFASSRKGDTNN